MSELIDSLEVGSFGFGVVFMNFLDGFLIDDFPELFFLCCKINTEFSFPLLELVGHLSLMLEEVDGGE